MARIRLRSCWFIGCVLAGCVAVTGCDDTDDILDMTTVDLAVAQRSAFACSDSAHLPVAK